MIIIYLQAFWLSVLFVGIGMKNINIINNQFLDNLFNYLIDIINIVFTGFLIIVFGRKLTIFLAVIVAWGLTVLAFFFSFIS